MKVKVYCGQVVCTNQLTLTGAVVAKIWKKLHSSTLHTSNFLLFAIMDIKVILMGKLRLPPNQAMHVISYKLAIHNNNIMLHSSLSLKFPEY